MFALDISWCKSSSKQSFVPRINPKCFCEGADSTEDPLNINGGCKTSFFLRQNITSVAWLVH